MTELPIIHGFSRLSRREKLNILQKQTRLSQATMDLFENHLHPISNIQDIYGDLSENTLSNFFLPLGLAPNFVINGKFLSLPMVIEESSVVAATSNAAKFWAMHGGFHSKVVGTSKVGQVHFTWSGTHENLNNAFIQSKDGLLQSVKKLTRKMESRGGGIESLELKAADPQLPGYYHLMVTFQTADAMGANFINSVLEALASKLGSVIASAMKEIDGEFEVLMSILSNYTPECRVECHVEANPEIFHSMTAHLSGIQFARKFQKAVDLAMHDPYRAVTHNKGIFNGMDAVLMATGNDYRAVEACGHAYAARSGSYRSLSRMELSEQSFRFTLDVPLALGSVGGLTRTHPMAGAALEILGNPSSEELMQIVAAAGLASNFSAIRALITSGIQKGHMKMHLGNILRQLKASEEEKDRALSYFSERSISHNEVASFLDSIRDQNQQE